MAYSPLSMFIDGRAAYQHFAPRTANPYTLDTRAHRERSVEWLAGWDDAKASGARRFSPLRSRGFHARHLARAAEVRRALADASAHTDRESLRAVHRSALDACLCERAYWPRRCYLSA